MIAGAESSFLGVIGVGEGLSVGGGGGWAGGRFDQISFAVLVAFGEVADEAGLAIEDASYIGCCHSRVAPSGVHG